MDESLTLRDWLHATCFSCLPCVGRQSENVNNDGLRLPSDAEYPENTQQLSRNQSLSEDLDALSLHSDIALANDSHRNRRRRLHQDSILNKGSGLSRWQLLKSWWGSGKNGPVALPDDEDDRDDDSFRENFDTRSFSNRRRKSKHSHSADDDSSTKRTGRKNRKANRKRHTAFPSSEPSISDNIHFPYYSQDFEPYYDYAEYDPDAMAYCNNNSFYQQNTWPEFVPQETYPHIDPDAYIVPGVLKASEQDNAQEGTPTEEEMVDCNNDDDADDVPDIAEDFLFSKKRQRKRGTSGLGSSTSGDSGSRCTSNITGSDNRGNEFERHYEESLNMSSNPPTRKAQHLHKTDDSDSVSSRANHSVTGSAASPRSDKHRKGKRQKRRMRDLDGYSNAQTSVTSAPSTEVSFNFSDGPRRSFSAHSVTSNKNLKPTDHGYPEGHPADT